LVTAHRGLWLLMLVAPAPDVSHQALRRVGPEHATFRLGCSTVARVFVGRGAGLASLPERRSAPRDPRSPSACLAVSSQSHRGIGAAPVTPAAHRQHSRRGLKWTGRYLSFFTWW